MKKKNKKEGNKLIFKFLNIIEVSLIEKETPIKNGKNSLTNTETYSEKVALDDPLSKPNNVNISSSKTNKKQIENLINLAGTQNSNILIEQMKLIQAENEKLKKKMSDLQKENSKFRAMENVPKSETKLESSNQEKVEEMEIKIKITKDARSELKEKKQKNLRIEMKNDKHKIKDFSKNKSNTKNTVKKPKIKHSKKDNEETESEYEVEDEDIDQTNFSNDSLFSDLNSNSNSKKNKNKTKLSLNEVKSTLGSVVSADDKEDKNIDSIINKSVLGLDKSIKWSLVTDHENFNKYLKLDDEHCPMPSSLSQDKFKNSSPFEIFSAFITDELLQHLVEATNEYMEEYRGQTMYALLKRPQHRKNYANLTLNEMKVFIAIKIYINFFLCHRKCGKR